MQDINKKEIEKFKLLIEEKKQAIQYYEGVVDLGLMDKQEFEEIKYIATRLIKMYEDNIQTIKGWKNNEIVQSEFGYNPYQE